VIIDQPRVTPTVQIGMDDPRAVSQGYRSDPPGSERRTLHGCAGTRRNDAHPGAWSAAAVR
jgi:hypothetical protein